MSRNFVGLLIWQKKIPQNPCCCTKTKNAFVKLANPDFAETFVKKFTYKQSMELDINSSQCAWFNFKLFELGSSETRSQKCFTGLYLQVCKNRHILKTFMATSVV